MEVKQAVRNIKAATNSNHRTTNNIAFRSITGPVSTSLITQQVKTQFLLGATG